MVMRKLADAIAGLIRCRSAFPFDIHEVGSTSLSIERERASSAADPDDRSWLSAAGSTGPTSG